MEKKNVFITGGTGYMGKRLIMLLLKKEYAVKALVRNGAEKKLPENCDFVIANPFDPLTFIQAIPQNAIFIQLLGVAHPGPKKKEQFKTIDLASAKASAFAGKQAAVNHFIYVSVAQTPVQIMQEYQQCRRQGEDAIKSTGLPATFIRPWYVTGPGHYWPLFFLPLFKLLEIIPGTSSKARALRLVSLQQMLNSLVYAVDHPPTSGIEIIEVEEILKFNY